MINIIHLLVCPNCKGKLSEIDDSLFCKSCNIKYNIINDIPVFLPFESQGNKFSMNYLEHYQKDAEVFDYFEERDCSATKHDERRLREYILSLIPKDVINVLDVGSGGAWVAGKLCKEKVNVCSFDISVKNAKSALQNVKSDFHTAVAGDALNPPFADNSFDAIIASEVIEHIVEPGDFVNKLLPLLKPEGKLIISTPYKEKIHISICIHCNQPTPQNAHLHSFDEKKLELFSFNKSNYSYYIFGNKALLMLRTNYILKFLPFFIWKAIDKISNIILNKPNHIISVYSK